MTAFNTSSTPKRIPILDLAPEIEFLYPQLTAAFARVLRSGRFILGPEVEAFESEAARFLGVKHAVGVSSGTDALILGLEALGIQPGDEVLVPSFTFFATPESVSQVGATPVFVDIDPATFNMDVDHAKSLVTARTKAIIPVHLFGHAADMSAVRELAAQHDLAILEDAAQAFGGHYGEHRIGTLGDAAAFSFFPTKNLGGFGDGGLLATNRDDVADQARRLRTHGSLIKYANEAIGYNARLDELQAALLRIKLPHVDEWNQRRVKTAAGYTQRLSTMDVQLPTVIPPADHVYHQFTIRVQNRNAVREQLAERGIQTMVYFPTPCHRLPVYADGATPPLPETDRAASEVLSLPIGPFVAEATLDRVATAVREVVGVSSS